MSENKRKYDSTVARIAGNIAGPLAAAQVSEHAHLRRPDSAIAERSVRLARLIVAEIEQTEIRENIPQNDTLAQADQTR